MREERGEVEVDGGTVRYRVLGEGERTLVTLHGGPGGGSLYLKPLERIPDSELVVFEEGSHMTFWEETERHLETVDTSLRSV